MDVMVAPERQRQGLGELLFSTWDRHVGASLGLGLSPSSHRLFQKLRWPEVGPVPYLVKPLTRRAFRRPEWPMVLNRLVSAVTLPYVKFVARQKPLLGRGAPDPPLRRLLRPAVGAGGAALRSRGAARRGLPAVEVRVAAARALRDRGALPRRRGAGLRRLPPRARAARQGHAARRLPGRSRRRRGARHAAALGRSRGARRGLGQDPRLLPARGLPQDPARRGLRAGGVDAAVRRSS